MSTKYATVAAIDVSKKDLEISCSMPLKFKSVTNDESGIARLIAEFNRIRPNIVIVEATGGYQSSVVDAVYDAKLSVHVSNPARIRHFALAAGILAKTDKVDAKTMVKFGQMMQPDPTPKPDPETREISDLRTRHQQLTDILVAEKNRAKQAPPSTKQSVDEHIAWLNTKIRDLETQMADKIKETEEFNKTAQILQSVPGVGPGTAAALIGMLPELGGISHKQIAALVGVAPYACDSGPMKGNRTIRGGRSSVRSALYMAVISSLRWNDTIKDYYKQLVKRGKRKKVAIIACIRKLITILNAMVRDQAKWCPDPIGG